MKEIKSINHHTRRKVLVPDSQPSKTDQSAAQDSDINIIVARYKQTGIMPEIRQTASQFIDCTKIGTFQDLRNQIANANSLFMQFPSEIRALMKNDPANVHDFFSDPRNEGLIKKYSLQAPEVPATPPNPVVEAIKDLTDHIKGTEDPTEKGRESRTSKSQKTGI